MALQQKITCDISGEEMDQGCKDKMTTCDIIYKKSGTIKDPRTKEDIKCIVGLEHFQLHICSEFSTKFMEGIQELLKKMKEEYHANNR